MQNVANGKFPELIMRLEESMLSARGKKLKICRAGALLTLILCAVPGCLPTVEEISRQVKQETEIEYRAANEVLAKCEQRLATDPEMAVIRGKSGISFNGCPIDYFDDKYPTKEELKAVKKYGQLMQACYDGYIKALPQPKTFEEFNIMLRTEKDGKENLKAVQALYAGKLTWAQFGIVCDKIATERMSVESAITQRNINQMEEGLNRQIREAQQRAAEERRHQEKIDTIRRSAPSSATCTDVGGGMSHCTLQ